VGTPDPVTLIQEALPGQLPVPPQHPPCDREGAGSPALLSLSPVSLSSPHSVKKHTGLLLFPFPCWHLNLVFLSQSVFTGETEKPHLHSCDRLAICLHHLAVPEHTVATEGHRAVVLAFQISETPWYEPSHLTTFIKQLHLRPGTAEQFPAFHRLIRNQKPYTTWNAGEGAPGHVACKERLAAHHLTEDPPDTTQQARGT
jgi:hypothetical protein